MKLEQSDWTGVDGVRVEQRECTRQFFSIEKLADNNSFIFRGRVGNENGFTAEITIRRGGINVERFSRPIGVNKLVEKFSPAFSGV